MAFVPAEDTVRVTAEFNHVSVGCVNVFYVHSNFGWSAATMEDLGEVLVAYFENAAHLAVISAQTSFRRVRLREMSTADGLQTVEEGSGTVGTAGSNPAPGSVTAVASLRSGLAGRSRRGRLYHVGLDESMYTANTLGSADRAALETEYERLVTAIAAGAPIGVDWELVVASFVSGGVERSTALLTPVTTITVDSTIDTQRRRLTGDQLQ